MSNFELPVAVEVYRRFSFARLLVRPCDGDYNGSTRRETILNLEGITTSQMSPLALDPEGITLPEAERIAREREPGDNSPQRTVVEQIETALESGGA